LLSNEVTEPVAGNGAPDDVNRLVIDWVAEKISNIFDNVANCLDFLKYS